MVNFKKLMVFFTILFLLAACSGQGDPNDAFNGADINFEDGVISGINGDLEGDERFRIGVSNAYITDEYRTQMIDDLLATNQEYINLGLTEELIIYSENTDVEGQLLQIENLMNQKIDALIIYPSFDDAIYEALEDIVNSGVVVISIGMEIDAAGVVNVAHNQKDWAESSATWLAESIQDGDVFFIEGKIGYPENEYRMEGAYQAVQKYPGINILASQSGEGTQAGGQQAMTDLLTNYPDVAGYWTQDGMATGALKTVIAATPIVFPKGVGEGSVEFLKLWKEVLDTNPEAEFIAVANAPGVGSAGLRIAVELLKGRVFKNDILSGQYGTTVTIPIPLIVTPENFQEVYAEYVIEGGYPDFYLLDYILTMEEVDAFFK